MNNEDGTTGLPQLGGADMLVAALRSTPRRPRAALLVVVWDDDTEVEIRLPDDVEEALEVLKKLKEVAREAADCFLRPGRLDS